MTSEGLIPDDSQKVLNPKALEKHAQRLGREGTIEAGYDRMETAVRLFEQACNLLGHARDVWNREGNDSRAARAQKLLDRWTQKGERAQRQLERGGIARLSVALLRSLPFWVTLAVMGDATYEAYPQLGATFWILVGMARRSARHT